MLKNIMRSFMTKKTPQSSSSSTGSLDQQAQEAEEALPESSTEAPKVKRKNTHDDSENLGEELAGVSTRVKSGSMKSKVQEEVKTGSSTT